MVMSSTGVKSGLKPAMVIMYRGSSAGGREWGNGAGQDAEGMCWWRLKLIE